MTDMDSLKWNNGCLEVVHFKDRQEVFESDLIDYHKKKGAELTPDKLLKTPELTPDLLRKEGEGRGERKDTTPLRIFAEMRKVLGYKEPQVCEPGSPAPGEKKEAKDPIPNYGKEGKAIKRILTRGFTREEIMACWKGKVSQRGGEFVSMTWVNEDIGKKGGKSSGTHKQGDKEPSAERYQRGLE